MEEEIIVIESESNDEETITLSPETDVSKYHDELVNRNLPNQHPISSITGLEDALSNAVKVEDVYVNGSTVLDANKIARVNIPDVETITNQEIENIIRIAF